jgi:MazG family protein
MIPPTKDPVPRQAAEAFMRLVDLMAFLKSPEGCEWDQAQTLDSLRPYLLEETYEVLDAMEALKPGDPESAAIHQKELGDLMLQIVFQSEIQRKAGHFHIGEVCQSIVDKLVRRHPHLFDEDFKRSGQEKPHWEDIKKAERKEAGESRPGALDGVPNHLPALLRAYRMGEKAHRIGFDWPDTRGVLAKIREEIDELEKAIEEGDAKESEKELGDLLYALVNLSRHLKVDPEAALRGTMARFKKRFAWVEESLYAEGKEASEVSLDDLEERWSQAKKALKT